MKGCNSEIRGSTDSRLVLCCQPIVVLARETILPTISDTLVRINEYYQYHYINMRTRAQSAKPSEEAASGLPAWMFEVDEYDETDAADTNILEELDLDFHLIFSIILWTIIRPLSACTRRLKMERHPLKFRPAYTSYWGPSGVLAAYAAILWLADLPNATWVFVIVIGASFFLHLTSRVFLRPPHTIHVILLGYSVFPLVPFAIVDVLVQPQYLYAVLGEIFVVLWATYVGYVSYIDICGPLESHTKEKWPLLYYPILLMNIYLISLLPYDGD